MQNVSIQKASGLSPPMKWAVEQLLGRTIAPDEEISVAATPPQHVPPSENRVALAQRLEAFLQRRAEKVRGVPEEAIEAAIEQVLEHVRHSRE